MATTSFSLTFLAKLVDLDQTGGNVFISPHSIATALSLAEAGATQDSDHARAFATVLGRDPPEAPATPIDNTGCELLTANAVYCKGSILSAYKDKVRELFDAGAEAMPETAAPINEWVADKTEGRVQDLLKDAHVQARIKLLFGNDLF